MLFQVVTFGNFQEADAHRVGNMAECKTVKVKAEILSITIDEWKGKSKKYFDPPGMVLYDNYGEVEIAYTMWEPSHNGKGQGGKVDGVVDLSKWSLSTSKTIPYGKTTDKNSYQFPKHNILLHDTCWADVKNLVVAMSVQEVDGGESYKKAWYKGPITKWISGTLIENAVTTVIDKVAKGPVGTVLTLPKSVYDAAHITKNDFLGANSIIYNLESNDLKKYYYYDFKTKGDSGNTTVKFRVVILDDPQKQASLGLPLDENYTASEIPDWIKQNADWWEQGLISDKDFASGLGFMVKERLIHVDNVDFDPNGDIEISDDIEIPDWIKNNARWWVDGVISDDDFKSGITHMVKEEVISFKEKPIAPTHSISSERSLELNSDNIKNLYELNKWNEITTKWLLEVKNAESELADELAKSAWNEYAEDKNQELMKRATDLDSIQKDSSNESAIIVGMLSNIKQIGEILDERATDLEISPGSLELFSSTAMIDLDVVQRLQNIQEIEEGYKQAGKAQKQAENKKTQLDSAVDDGGNVRNPEYIFDINYPRNHYPIQISITEKQGNFLGDPCNDQSKIINLFYKIKFSDIIHTQSNLRLVVDHYFESKKIDQHIVKTERHYSTEFTPTNSGTFSIYSGTFSINHELPAGKHTFLVDSIMVDAVNESFDSYVFKRNLSVTTEVIVPPCNFDSAVDDSDEYALIPYERKELHAILEKIIFDSDELSKIIDNGKKTISTLDNSEMDDYLPGLDDDIDDNSLPGLDYDLTEEEVREIEYEGSSNVELFIISEEIDPNCKGMISIDIQIGNEDLVNQNLWIPIDVTLIETGPRGILTHIVQAHAGDGQLTINDIPPGTYSFEIKSAILQNDSKIDIFSGNVVYPGGQLNPTTIEDCPDDTSLLDSEESASSVTSDAQCTDDYFGYGEIKVIDQWASYEADSPYYFLNVGWALQHTNPSYQNNVNSMTVDLDMTGPEGWSPPSKTVRTDGDGNLQISWNTQIPGTYTFTITNFQNMGSYCGDGDTITLAIP